MCLFLALCVLSGTTSAWAALSVVGASTDTVHTAGGGATNFNSGHAHTAGNLLVVLISTQTSGTPTIANTAADTWHQCGTTVSNGSNHLFTFSASTAGNANDVVQVTVPSVATYDSYRLYEVHSSLLSFVGNACDATSTGTGTGTSLATGTITISGAADFIAAVMEHNAGAGLTAGTSYTLVDDQGAGGAGFVAAEYHIVSASEAATATTSAGSGTWAIFGAAFKEGGGVVTTHCTGMMLGVWRCGV